MACFITFIQFVNATKIFTVHLWLADVESDTETIQICMDVEETFSSVCRIINTVTLDRVVSNPEQNESVLFDAGYFNFTESQLPSDADVSLCVYSFKYKNGNCEILSNPVYDIENKVVIRVNYSPVFYDEEDKRIYKYGQNYRNGSGQIFMFEHEPISIPTS